MKQQSDRPLLLILAIIALTVIVFCCMVMTFGWFGFGAVQPDVASAVISETGDGVSRASVIIKPVNVNTANAETLDTLPGIGPVLADRIVEYRTQNGFFSQPEELLAVEGIGETILENIKPYIEFE